MAKYLDGVKLSRLSCKFEDLMATYETNTGYSIRYAVDKINNTFKHSIKVTATATFIVHWDEDESTSVERTHMNKLEKLCEAISNAVSYEIEVHKIN